MSMSRDAHFASETNDDKYMIRKPISVCRFH